MRWAELLIWTVTLAEASVARQAVRHRPARSRKTRMNGGMTHYAS